MDKGCIIRLYDISLKRKDVLSFPQAKNDSCLFVLLGISARYCTDSLTELATTTPNHK